jgi:hypothetical protein
MHPPRGLATVLAAVAVLGLGGAAAVAGRPSTPPATAQLVPVRWVWPLFPAPAVLRAFAPPPLPWLAGHRGVDLGGSKGQPVRAAGDGVVAFAGRVAGRGVVSVDHPGGLRTTYEPVRASVQSGQAVTAGLTLGVLVAGHAGCPAPVCLHWGLRRGRAYLDPLLLVRPVRLKPLASGARMGLVVDAAQTFARHVRVDLRAGQRGVPEQFLYGAEVGASLQHVGRRGVAQAVGGRVRQTQRLRPRRDDLPYGARVETAAARAEQERGAAVGRGERGPPVTQPRLDGALGRHSKGDGALPGALAEDAHDTAGQVDVVDVEPAQLGDADPAGVEHLQDGGVAEPDRVRPLVRVGAGAGR